MNAGRRVRIGIAALWLGVLAPGAYANELPVEAVWKPQRAIFSFFGQTTRYACDELERRLRRVLVVLGAHEEMRIDRRHCSPYTGMRLDITFRSPIEATPENVHALTTFEPEEILVARLRGFDLPSAEDLPRFPAEWQAISLSRDEHVHLRAGDCELLEQIRQQILPLLATRGAPRRIVCSPGNLSMRAPPLSVSALIASTQ